MSDIILNNDLPAGPQVCKEKTLISGYVLQPNGSTDKLSFPQIYSFTLSLIKNITAPPTFKTLLCAIIFKTAIT